MSSAVLVAALRRSSALRPALLFRRLSAAVALFCIAPSSVRFAGGRHHLFGSRSFASQTAQQQQQQPVSDEEIDAAQLKCDPYEQNGQPLSRTDADAYLLRLAPGWRIVDQPAAAAPPPIAPTFKSAPPLPSQQPEMRQQSMPAVGGCGSNACPCAVQAAVVGESRLVCSSSISSSTSSSASCSAAAAVAVPSIVSGAGANARRFKGGLMLRREWYFRTVSSGVDFVQQIKIVATNQGHQPYRAVLDASRGYGHVVCEFYTTRLGGLSFNDFRFAQTLDGALHAYRERASKKQNA